MSKQWKQVASVERSKSLVAYLRVSTRKQGASGLGLEAQRAAVAEFAKREGLRVVAEYVEVESGRKAARPELAKAVSHCRAAKACLVVAKLDRLARNVAFLSSLMEAGLEFVALDMEHANKFTIHIMLAVAEQEARAASERTKAALAAAKRRGVLLGSSRPGHWRGREARRLTGARRGVQRAAELRTQEARQHNALAVAEALKLRDRGMSWMDIAAELNKRGLVTRRGNQWSKSSVFMAVRAAAGCAAVVSATAGAFGQWSAALV
ncbi:MAG: recombinase family protein [Caulobacteraceae bacterium]|nr:recombinase family protein [Caulobacteraceae bacterium]